MTAVEAPSVTTPTTRRSPTGGRGREVGGGAGWLASVALPSSCSILVPMASSPAPPLITGHPLLIGDDLVQSYPLRALVGTDLAPRQMPLWDPWIWSGTPLMAGLNAGAFYPTTFLFAIMPPTAPG